MNLILYGFPCCGKTSCGILAARRLERTFIDIDDIIEALFFDPSHGRSMDLTCRQIFREYGDDYFRKLERDAIRRLRWLERAVVASGGGAVLDFINHQELSKLGRLTYLKLDQETLKQRLLSQDDLPAFLDPYQLDESIDHLYTTRATIYERIADEIIDVSQLSCDEVAEKISSLVAIQQD